MQIPIFMGGKPCRLGFLSVTAGIDVPKRGALMLKILFSAQCVHKNSQRFDCVLKKTHNGCLHTFYCDEAEKAPPCWFLLNGGACFIGRYFVDLENIVRL